MNSTAAYGGGSGAYRLAFGEVTDKSSVVVFFRLTMYMINFEEQ